MSTDSTLISLIAKRPATLTRLQAMGIDHTYFVEPYDEVFRYVESAKRKHGSVPSPDVIESRFSEQGIELHRARDRDLAHLADELMARRKYLDFAEAVEDAIAHANPNQLEEVVSQLQGSLARIGSKGRKDSVVDLFSPKVRERMLGDYENRRRGEMIGIPTGLKRFDITTGGLQKGRNVVMMARTGVGKTWYSLHVVCRAVTTGHKVVVFPLEMSLEETAYRIYTLLSSSMYGSDKALKNMDLTLGRITKYKLAKFMAVLEDRYQGQLYIADIAAMSDPYTVERIEAEVAARKPDLYSVDYITLLKAPGVGRDGGEDHTTIKHLSNGCKGISIRNKTVGLINAQVNRDALKTNHPLPRLDHLAYGDAIGQDADQVISLGRRGNSTFYGLTKNRHGPEFGKTRVKWLVDCGLIEEYEQQEEDDDD